MEDIIQAAIPLLPLLILGLGLALQILFPTKTEQVGPRVTDLKISTSTYGDHLARVYGRAKVAGAVIWVENNQVKEVVTTTVEKQKLFGLFTIGETKITEFSYFATFAMAFTHHEITDFGKVFIDDEIWADFTSDDDVGINVRRYRGTATQTPPSQMVDDNGADNTPAYRGVSFLLFDNLSLEEIGVRIPNVEAEIIVDANVTAELNSYTNVSSNHTAIGDDVDFEQGIVANVWSGGTVTIWQKTTRNVIWFENVETRDSISIGSGALLDGRGNLFITSGITTKDLHIYDVFTSKKKQTIVGFHDDLGTCYSALTYNSFTGARIGFFYKGNSASQTSTALNGTVTATSFVTNGALNATAGDVFGITMKAPDPLKGIDGVAYVFGDASGTATIQLHDLLDGTISSFNMSTIIGDTSVEALAYLSLDDTLILVSSADNLLYKLNATTPTTVIETLELPSNFAMAPNTDKFMWSKRGMSPDGRTALINTGATTSTEDYIFIIDCGNMEIIETFSKGDVGLTGGAGGALEGDDWLFDYKLYAIMAWDDSGAFGIKQLKLPRAQSGRIPLSTIYSGETALAGISASKVDVTGITGDTLGYAIKDSTTPRAVIEDVNRIKSKDFAHVDGGLKFFDKVTVPSKTIILDDTGASLSEQRSKTRVEEEYSDPTEIPKAVTIEYPAFDANYRTGAQKITVPDGLDAAKEQLQFNTNMTMNDDEAAKAADIILLESRDVSLKYRTNVLPKHYDLHAGDVVTLHLDENRQENVVLNEITQDVLLELDTHRRQFDFASNAVGVPTNDGTLTRPNLAQAIFLPLDIPIVRDIDDDSGFYWGLYTLANGSFLSAVVHRSADLGGTWTLFGSVNQEAFVAAAVEPLAGGIEKAWTLDTVTTLDVIGLTGTLTSVTLADALNGYNLFAIKSGNQWELANAVTVTEVTTGRYILSDWIRGRSGTENYIDGHSAGDLLVRLSPPDIGLLAGNASVFRSSENSKDIVYDYLARTIGLPPDGGNQVQFTNTAIGKRPYAPWPVEGTRDVSENLDLTWTRRDRLYHHWLGGTVPLSETSEAYEIDIYEGMSLLRTVTGLTSPLYEYTLSSYQTDSGNGSATEIPTVTVYVFQISTIFGRGEAIGVDL